MTDVSLFKNEINRFLTDRNGPVGHLLLNIGVAVRDNAKVRVGVSEPNPGEEDSGRHLQDAIQARLEEGPVCQVGTFEPGVGYALYHHDGTAPHPIDPIPPNTVLVFYWKQVGQVVYLRHVDHPGTAPNRYLTDALADEVSRFT